MTPPRSVEEWAAHLCEYHKVYDSECGYCGEARDSLLAYAAEQVAQARTEERKRAIGYLQMLQANHPHLQDAYRHAELNLRAVLETDWQPDTAAIRGRK